MAVPTVSRQPRLFIALALAGIGPAACGSAAPTAPTPRPAAPEPASSAAASSASLTDATATANRAAAATTIKIKEGTLSLQTLQPGTVRLRGNHGFRFDGAVRSGLEPSAYCPPYSPCPPGATVPFRAAWEGSDIPGTVRLQGNDFTVGIGDIGSMYLELTGSFVAPPHVAPTTTVTVPFTAAGLLFRDSGYPTRTLTGGGTVTFTLEWQDALGGNWGIRYTTFDFDAGNAS